MYLYEASGRRAPVVAGLGATATELAKELAKQVAKRKILITRRQSLYYDLYKVYKQPKSKNLTAAWITYFGAIRAGQAATRPTIGMPTSGTTSEKIATLKHWNSLTSSQITKLVARINELKTSMTVTAAAAPTVTYAEATPPPTTSFVAPRPTPLPKTPVTVEEIVAEEVVKEPEVAQEIASEKDFPWLIVGGVAGVGVLGLVLLRRRRK